MYQLWRTNKITRTEFKLLTSRIKITTWLDVIIELVFNPYAKLHPSTALIVGISLIILSSLIASVTGFHFPGIPGSEEILKLPIKLGFTRILFEHTLQWLSLSIVFYLIAKIIKARNLRVFDFFAFFAMAYLAKVCFGIELLIIKLISPSFFVMLDNTPQLILHYPKILISVSIFMRWLMYIWLYLLYFASLELSCSLTKTKLWIIYMTGLVLANTICYAIYNNLFTLSH